jgi:hypothetical protein
MTTGTLWREEGGPYNVPVERQQIDLNDRRKNSQLSAPTGLCRFL